MSPTVASVIRTYLEDEAAQESWQPILESRIASIPQFRRIVGDFVDGTINIGAFREQINKALLSLDTWGANGGWMMELNKIARSYGTMGETALRQILTGLNASNLGERIEQFHTFAVQQKQVLRQQGVKGTVNPGNSAFIVSLFAFWLDPNGGAHIYYISLKRSLKRMLDKGLLPQSIGLRVNSDAIIVVNATDHNAAQQAIDMIAAADPKIKTDPYWAEKFLSWLDENPAVLDEEDDPTPVVNPTVDDPTPVVNPAVIEHGPLARIPAALLNQRIGELRRHVLIDEAVVRRIYHGLLAGHVILTGPPGTGKTELARLVPELLWQGEEAAESGTDPYGNPISTAPTTHTAYTTRLVTATDEWSVRTLIGGLAPASNGGKVIYRTQYGHLAEALFSNWAISRHNSASWSNANRVSVRSAGVLSDGEEQEFRGVWLVIDEFNRAPIDLALGEALTALGGSGQLRVPIDGGSAELPMPLDFRIIGTLNSFDRNYLNQISEALKRRFAFIEILPPTRKDREAELAIALHKALSSIGHLDPDAIKGSHDRTLMWNTILTITPDSDAVYQITWQAQAAPFREIAEAAWRTFEVIRVYRQLGTAQAISLFRHLLIAGIAENYTTAQQWYNALDQALCDTVADQLQVLLPDELEILIAYSTLPADGFIVGYRAMLERERISGGRRFAAQLETLATIARNDGSPLIAASDVVQMIEADTIAVPDEAITTAFRLDAPFFTLPQFARRLRAYRSDRGL